MYVGYSLKELAAQAHFEHVVVACGVFDGVHRGHQRIISRLKKLAAAKASHPVVVTFDPHPRAVLYPDEPPQYLTTTAQQIRLLGQLGVEGVVILPFSRQMADMLPWDFLLRELLQQGPEICGICVGEDWRFGRGTDSGDVDLLREAGKVYNFVVEAVPPLMWYRYPVSSTRIRQAISRSRLRHAARMLTRPHTIRGSVQRGRGQARESLQYPTANLDDPEVMLPPDGVYAARAKVNLDEYAENNACAYDGIVYIGRAPTFVSSNELTSRKTTVELHIFGYGGDLYGCILEIELHAYVRSSFQFESPAALKQQIQQDVAAVPRLLQG